MRIAVNLATRPFIELRPFFLRLRLIMAALVLVGLALAVGAHLISAKAETQQLDLDRLRNLTIATEHAKLETEGRMRQPDNAAVLDRAHFLNALFLRKSFSWTAVMMDLEDVLPSGVQVTSIEPAVTADGAVLIRLRVAGERDRAVQLVRNLERSRRFLEPRLGSESAQTKESAGGNGLNAGNGASSAIGPNSLNGGARGASGSALTTGPPPVEFEILANYNPLPAGEAYHAGHGRGSLTGAAPVAAAAMTTPAVLAASVAQQPQAAPAEQATTIPVTTPRAPVDAGGTPGRFGYPRDGVVLPPYRGGPARPQDGTLPPVRVPGAGGPL